MTNDITKSNNYLSKAQAGSYIVISQKRSNTGQLISGMIKFIQLQKSEA